ncbi:MAG: hypothetical protein KKB70_10620 [Proteobacteria bacterium]|nr:hypothetical protein [Pseudomonadota bacterium]MBU1610956.1 hypothetical protein [Pseudomonadota bacterium]
MPDPAMRLEYPSVVRMHEVGLDGVAPLPVLLNYFQEAASIHAATLGWGRDEMLAENLTWVLARLFVEIDRQPAPWETVITTTWPVRREKYTARRDFSFSDAAGQVWARGTTSWAMIDIDARRMVSIPASFGKHFENSFPGHLEFVGKRVAALGGEPLQVSQVTARLFDLDVNGHVNNTHFASWALEAVPDAFAATHRLTAFDMQYRAEVRRGDMVRSLCGTGGEGELLHALVRDDDATEVARARTTWQTR